MFVVFAALFVAVPLFLWYLAGGFSKDADEMNLMKIVKVALKYRAIDFVKFTKEHWEIFAECKKTGNYGPAVCHYYSIMADLITAARGPYWHFVPVKPNVSNRESHEQFHKTLLQYLEAKKGDNILELGAGFGECGRRVAHYTGSNVTALTMADEEITGGNERIKKAGLEKQCRMVQGDYHDMAMFADNTFDAVFGIYCLKYSGNLNKVVKEAHRILKPGGKFVVYCILTSDHYDPTDQKQKRWVEWISEATGMPPLWSSKDHRDAAAKAGFGDHTDTDIAVEGDLAWYRTFDLVIGILESRIILKLIELAEVLGIVGKGFTVFYNTFLVHPSTDFVYAGRANVITCTNMMKWVKK